MLNLIQTNGGNTIVVEKNTRDFLLDALVKKMDELGRVPTREEVAQDKKMPAVNNFVYIFASYDNAVEEAVLYKKGKEGITPVIKVREKYSSYFKNKISSPSSQQ